MRKALTILLAAAFLLASYVPVAAADWDLYGSVQVETFWTDYDEDHFSDFEDVTDLSHTLLGTSRIGASVDAGAIGGHFEYGASGGSANIRLLYATFDVGPGQLLVGQDYGPYAMGSYISGQVYAGNANMTEFIGDTSRRPMVQYTVDNFSFALVEPGRDLSGDLGLADDLPGNDIEVIFPQIQARYHTMFEDIGFNIAGVFQTFDIEDDGEDLDGETLNAWAVTANVRFNQLDPLYFNFGGYYGQNVAHFGQSYCDRIAGWAQDDGVDSIEDTDTFGLLFVAGTSINDIGLEAGVGYLESDNDMWDDNLELMAYYAQAKIPMLSGYNAYIIPEVGYYDWDEAADTDEFYAGVQWRVDF